MNLLAISIALSVVTDSSNVAEAKGLTGLSTDHNTAFLVQGGLTVTSLKGIGISVSLDGATELFSRHQVQILDIIGVQRGSLSAGGTLSHGGQTVPSHTVAIRTVFLYVQDAVLYASFIQARTLLVPFNCIISSHNYRPPFNNKL
jgi:hypothetical protein